MKVVDRDFYDSGMRKRDDVLGVVLRRYQESACASVKVWLYCVGALASSSDKCIKY
jgi:hypothetical protein